MRNLLRNVNSTDSYYENDPIHQQLQLDNLLLPDITNFIFTPTFVCVALYILLFVVTLLEYKSSLSQQQQQQQQRNTSIPQISNHSNLNSRIGIGIGGDAADDGSTKNARNYAGTGAGTTGTGTGSSGNGRRGYGYNHRMDSPSTIGDSSLHPLPGDVKSPGEIYRTLFYKYLMLSLMLRLLLIPIQRAYSKIPTEHNDITILVSRTLPTLTFILSYTILIFFYAQVTFIATGRSANNNNNNNMSMVNVNSGNGCWMKPMYIEHTLLKLLYGIYGALIFFNNIIPIISMTILNFSVWAMLCLYHSVLFISMTYFGTSLVSVLKSNLTGGLGWRLIGMSFVCITTFLLHSILDGWEAYSILYRISNGIKYIHLFPTFNNHLHLVGLYDDGFGRDVVGYLFLEWLPAIFVLTMMHKKSTNNNNNETAVGMEGGPYSPVGFGGGGGGGAGNADPHAQQQQLHIDNTKLKSSGLGVKRSFSANGGAPIHLVNRTMMQQQQQPQQPQPTSSGQRILGSSYGMMRNTPATTAAVGGRGEAASLLGEKSVSATASSSSYGAFKNTKDVTL